MAWYHDFYVRHGALLIPLFDIVEAEGLTETHLSFLDRALEGLPEGARILDLGCGVGRLAIPLAARGYRVTCYDVSPPLLEEARRRARARPLTSAMPVRAPKREIRMGARERAPAIEARLAAMYCLVFPYVIRR